MLDVMPVLMVEQVFPETLNGRSGPHTAGRRTTERCRRSLAVGVGVKSRCQNLDLQIGIKDLQIEIKGPAAGRELTILQSTNPIGEQGMPGRPPPWRTSARRDTRS